MTSKRRLYHQRRRAGECIQCGAPAKLARCLACHVRQPGRTARGYGTGAPFDWRRDPKLQAARERAIAATVRVVDRAAVEAEMRAAGRIA